MTSTEITAELDAVRAEINRQYWAFTRTARGKPVDPALRRREATLETELRRLVDPASDLRRAIAASGLSARAFAAFLEVDERTVRRWLADERDMPGPVRVICRAILRDPAIVAALAPSTRE